MNSDRPLRFLPKTRDIFFMALFIAVLSVGRQMLNIDGDLPRHLLMGRYMTQNSAVITTELFIYPYLDQPYVLHEWLADVLFFGIYSLWGLDGLVVFAAFLLAVTFSILYSWLSTKLNLRLPVLMLVAWGAMATSLNWAVRPHLISMCLLAIWLIWTDALSRGEKIPVWRFPVLMLFWSNFHGEFIAGILVLLAYSVGWAIDYLLSRGKESLVVGRKIWMAFALSAAASLLNPSGVGPWVSILGFVNNDYLMSRMSETNPPDFRIPEMSVLLGLLTLSIFLLAIKKRNLSAGQGLLLAGFSAMSLIMTRNIHLYGIVAPIVLAEALGPIRDIPFVSRLESTVQQLESKNQGLIWITVFVFAFSSIAITSDRMEGTYQFQQPAFPVQATNWLESNPQKGRMFNNLDWGGYLAFRLWPEQLPFIDSMSDNTGQVTRQYEDMITLRDDWQATLKEYDITWAIIPPQWPLAQALKDGGWEIVYGDQTAVILIQK